MSIRTVTRGLALVLGASLLWGCPEQPDQPDPGLTLANRRAPVDLAEGGEIEVFPPPQGGVFAELDVSIENMETSELEYLSIIIDDADTGEQYAYVRYYGDSIPLERSPADDILRVANLPVGFVEQYRLEDLDGQAVVVTGTLETPAGEFPVEYDATLLRTEY